MFHYPQLKLPQKEDWQAFIYIYIPYRQQGRHEFCEVGRVLFCAALGSNADLV